MITIFINGVEVMPAAVRITQPRCSCGCGRLSDTPVFEIDAR